MNDENTPKTSVDAARSVESPSNEREVLKRGVGRPLKFADAGVLRNALEAYFKRCDVGQKTQVVSNGRVVDVMEPIPYTITGLCNVLDIERSTLIDYGDGKYDDVDPEFSNTVKKAKRKVLERIEANLYNGKPAVGAIFSLKNNNQWRDRTEVEAEITGNMTVETVSYAGASRVAPPGADQGDEDGTAPTGT